MKIKSSLVVFNSTGPFDPNLALKHNWSVELELAGHRQVWSYFICRAYRLFAVVAAFRLTLLGAKYGLTLTDSSLLTDI
jgi:hypothetical protein